jgi:hypothetical protein
MRQPCCSANADAQAECLLRRVNDHALAALSIEQCNCVGADRRQFLCFNLHGYIHAGCAASFNHQAQSIQTGYR